jgi:hypothetical protein
MENDNILLSCNWNKFEAWIRKQVGGDFSWKIRPMETEKSREIIIDSLKMAIRNNNGVFPEEGYMFIEKSETIVNSFF